MTTKATAKSKLRNEIGIGRSVGKQGSSSRIFYQHNSNNVHAHYEEFINWRKLDYEVHYEKIIEAARAHFAPKAKRPLFCEKRYSVH